jgi:hypothetical protein
MTLEFCDSGSGLVIRDSDSSTVVVLEATGDGKWNVYQNGVLMGGIGE